MIFARKSFDDAIIQKNELTQVSIDTALISSAAMGVFLTFSCILVSPIVSIFYDEKDIILVLCVLSLNLFIGSVAAVPKALLRRNLEFKSLAICHILARLTAGLIGVIILGVWSVESSYFSDNW